MNEKAQILFDYIKSLFPEQDDIGIFNLMMSIDNKVYCHLMKTLTGTTWVKVPTGVCPIELKDKYTSKGIECF